MATAPFPSHSLSAYIHQQSLSRMAFRTPSPFLHGLKGSLMYFKGDRCGFNLKSNGVIQRNKPMICAMAADQSGDSDKLNLESVIEKARRLWDSSPQPVKEFPWNRAFENFIQLFLDLILAVVKYLSVPLLVVTSLSEMSYCAHVKKLPLVPVPLLIGFVVAGVLGETALELSSLLKDAKVPWHLIAIAIFFTLIKLPGPYYPFLLRIFIPHFANGALWRTLWLMFLWYRRPKMASRTSM
ncbi:hypothetical protein SLEP1_g31253 [Rubroshorea leprosula]|uniref:Embryo defective 1273 n=1 Tax=Rubroshorea leprosula TaxID=152421 RepID=A0AAV5K881_9ROSI|nr:hypothetical protein SLEP1_g31253 [Rubroshorea leprosula]